MMELKLLGCDNFPVSNIFFVLKLTASATQKGDDRSFKPHIHYENETFLLQGISSFEVLNFTTGGTESSRF